MDPNFNSIIYQVVYGMKKQQCSLSYSWAARESNDLDSSQFTVTWDGVVLQNGKPTDYDLHHESFTVSTSGNHRDALTFIGSGKSDGGGATFGNIKLTCP